MKCILCGYEPRQTHLYLDDFEKITIKYKDEYEEKYHKTLLICPNCGIVFVDVKKDDSNERRENLSVVDDDISNAT